MCMFAALWFYNTLCNAIIYKRLNYRIATGRVVFTTSLMTRNISLQLCLCAQRLYRFYRRHPSQTHVVLT